MSEVSVAALQEAARAKQAVRERVWALLERERAARAGRRIAVPELQPVDLVVCGSVAVNRRGAGRIDWTIARP